MMLFLLAEWGNGSILRLLVPLCSCASTEAGVASFDRELLHLTRVKSLIANSEVGIHTTSGLG